MQLKFYARPEHLQPWPASHAYGQPRRYIGWQWLAPEGDGQGARYAPKKDGDVVDEARVPSASVDDIKKACRDGSLIAADEATAKACSVAYAKHKFTEAGFVPEPDTTKAGTKPAAPKE
jgi:hypothetical protein